MTDATYVLAYQWACPLRACTWTIVGSENELKAAFLPDPLIALEVFRHPGGEIYEHIHNAHLVEEWVQELLELQRDHLSDERKEC